MTLSLSDSPTVWADSRLCVDHVRSKNSFTTPFSELLEHLNRYTCFPALDGWNWDAPFRTQLCDCDTPESMSSVVPGPGLPRLGVEEGVFLGLVLDAAVDLKKWLSRLELDPTSRYYLTKAKEAASLYLKQQVRLIIDVPKKGGYPAAPGERLWHYGGKPYGTPGRCSLGHAQHLALNTYHTKLEKVLTTEIPWPFARQIEMLIWCFAVTPHYSVHEVWQYRTPPKTSPADAQNELEETYDLAMTAACSYGWGWDVRPNEQPPKNHVRDRVFKQDCCMAVCANLCDYAQQMYA